MLFECNYTFEIVWYCFLLFWHKALYTFFKASKYILIQLVSNQVSMVTLTKESQPHSETTATQTKRSRTTIFTRSHEITAVHRSSLSLERLVSLQSQQPGIVRFWCLPRWGELEELPTPS